MYRRLLASFAFLFVTLSSFSQNANTLLWRISGNGLKQSSYLFGTMHLTDKRLFNFDDSLYHALEVTDGTAIEVNPDEMMAYAFNEELDHIQEGRSLKDILSEKDYKKYSAALAKKLNKPASEITEKDLLLEKNSWTTEYLAKGEMPTFVDAYLFYTAKKQAKWVGGIEDITDQAGLLENIDKADIEFMLNKNAKDVADNMMEHMIALYTNQDIDELCRFTSGEDSAKHDAVITRRNIKMAYRIDSIAHTRSMLFAIGAAHLANDEGVISLLRKRGFTVTPVMGSKKISSDDYKFVEKPMPWYAVNDAQGLYSALMPGNPFAKDMSGVVSGQFYFDLSSYSGYFIMTIVSPGKILNKDSVFQAFASNVFKDDKKLKPVPVIKDGLTGAEYMSVTRNINARVQLFLKGNVIYVPMFYALKKDSLQGVNAKTFFDSFVMKDIPTADGRLYSDTTAGLVVTLPVQLQYSSQLSRANLNGWNIKGYGGTDANSGVYIAKYEKRPVAGSNIISDSTLFAQVRKGMKERMTETKYEELKVDGYNASYFVGQTNGFEGRFLNIVRGNTNLGILVVGDPKAINQPVFENIFKTIKAVPLKTTQWKSYAVADNSLKLFAPAEFTHEKDSTADRNFFLSYDSLSGINIMVTVDSINKYWWYTSDSSFWMFSKKNVGENDSIVSSTISKKGKIATNDMMIKMGGAQTYTRSRHYQYGNIVYGISVAGESDVLKSENVNKLMEDVQFNNSLVDFNLTESKASLILNDLSSKDSAVLDGAYDAMRSSKFDSTNIPLLHECLLKKYPAPYPYADTSDVNELIVSKLSALASPSTIPFVCANYNSLTGDKKYLRTSLLKLLSLINTKQSYDALFSLLKTYPADELPFSFSANIADSLKLAANYSEGILSFIKDTARGLQMTRIINRLTDSSLITLEMVKKYENDFIALSKYDLSKTEHNWRSSDLVEVLGKIKTQKSFAAIRGYLNVKDVKYVKEKAVIVLVKKNQPVSTTIMNNMAADREMRWPMFQDLTEVKKQALFPKLYLTQQSLGESILYQAASDDHSVKSIKFIATKTATLHNKKYKFYLFKVTLGEEEGSYLGIAGAFDITGKSFEPKRDITSLYFEEEFDATKINEQFNNWLGEYEAEEE